MTKDKVKEIIEDIFEGEWKENAFISTNYKINIDSMTTINLLLEQNYIQENFSETSPFPIITLN
jgi:acyl carrier protein